MKKHVFKSFTMLLALAALCLLFLSPKASAATNGWGTENGHKVYYVNGSKVTGFKDIGSHRYYFDHDGYMKTGWIYYWYSANYENRSFWYYADENGVLQSGWKKIERNWYYFDGNPDSYLPDVYKYHMLSLQDIDGCLTMIDGKYYILDADGVMRTGWYCHKYPASGDFDEIHVNWFFAGADGVVVRSGWQKSEGKWYYFDDFDYQTGWKKIGGKWYFFKSNGEMAAKEWCDGYWLNADGTWTYQYKASWKKNAKGWWFGDTSGWYAKSCTITINDKQYTFDANGYWVK